MSERGVFAVDRGIWDHPLFADEGFSEREAFIWLVGQASFKPRRVRVGSTFIEVGRGQLVHSLRFMAQKWKWPEPRVRRFLKRLKSDAAIDADSDAGQTRITICNYDAYQKVSLPADAPNDAPSDAPATQHRRKEEDKENTKSLFEPAAIPPQPKVTTEKFEEFRKAYPKREGADPKDTARKRFAAAVKSGEDPDAIIAGARAFAAAEAKRGNIGSRFIPHSASWLNRRGWEDVVELPFAPPPPPPPAEQDALWRRRLTIWRETGDWNGHWGNHPETPGFQVLCPKTVLREFNLERPAA